VEEIGEFIERYANDHDGNLPSVRTVVMALDPDGAHTHHGSRTIVTGSGSFTETWSGDTDEQDMKRGIWHAGWEAGHAGKPYSANPH
jgi:hypothetical protein